MLPMVNLRAVPLIHRYDTHMMARHPHLGSCRQDTPADMISAVYCGWAAADCVVVDGVRRSADPGRTSKR